MRTIAIVNQKGGCGKTTTAVNLSAALAIAQRRVLLIDLDPQGHATLAFGYEPRAIDKTIYNTLVEPGFEIRQAILDTRIEWLDLVASNVLLSGAELELVGLPRRQFVLSERLERVSNDYDICVIDCPPSLGILTLNALLASTDVVVPVQAHYYAMEGLKELFETAQIVRERFYPCNVRIMGLLLTLAEDTNLFGRQIQKQMRDYFKDLVFKTAIHRTVRLAEAPSAGQSVLTYAPKSRGAFEYTALAQEVLGNIQKSEYVRRERYCEVSLPTIGAMRV
jgi:chromosome partitioning protein